MTNELYQRLDDLIKDNKELTIKLAVADSEIANLKVHVKVLEKGQLELSVGLADSNNEVGRLTMRLTHRDADLAIIKRQDKLGK